MKLLLQNTDRGLIPLYDSDLDNKKKLKLGEVYQATIVMPRNIKFHRKFFALINMVYNNQEIYNNIDVLRSDLTIAAGFYDTHTTFNGKERIEARSISFGSMDEIEFEKLYNAFIIVVVKYFKFDKQDILDNIEQYF